MIKKLIFFITTIFSSRAIFLLSLIFFFNPREGAGEGGRTRANWFVLTKIGSKLDLFLMQPLREKCGKICQGTKKKTP